MLVFPKVTSFAVLVAISNALSASIDDLLELESAEDIHSLHYKWFVPNDTATIPDSLDWRDKGAVTNVEDEGNCFSAWAFAATGALEAQMFKKTKKLISLSKQNLIDCVKANLDDSQKCQQEWAFAAFNYVIRNRGIDTEESYPYEAKGGSCRYTRKNRGGYVDESMRVPENDNALRNALATVGPISVLLAREERFSAYKGGVFDIPNCPKHKPFHAFLLIGYGTDKATGSPYWLLKNSKGSKWGENGYMRIARKENICGIANYAFFPRVF